ncbi:MAG: hypothetical protein ABH824_00580 [Nanoarchaeota archaeon]
MTKKRNTEKDIEKQEELEKRVEEKLEKETARIEKTLPDLNAIREKIKSLKKTRDVRSKDIDVAVKETCGKIDEAHKEAAKSEKEEVREKAKLDKQKIKDHADGAIVKWESVIEAQIDAAKREREAEIRADLEDEE